MKIYLRLPSGAEFSLEREPRAPAGMARSYTLAALAAFALLLTALLLWQVWR